MVRPWRDAQRFLDETFGMVLKVDGESIDDRFPLHLGRRYMLARATIVGEPSVLMSPREGVELPPWNMWKHHAELVREKMGCPVVLVVDRIQSSMRRSMAKQRLPFIVPGLEIFLPTVAAAFRKRGQGVKGRTSQTLRPATQALFLYLLHMPGDSQRSTRQLAEIVGFSPMSMSRAQEELEDHDLVGELGKKRRRMDLWKRAQPHLINPVRKTIACTYPPMAEQYFSKSGEAAMSHYTELVGNGPPRLAMTSEEWKLHQVDENLVATWQATRDGNVKLKDHGGTNAIFRVTQDDIRTSPGVEIWRYPPVWTPWVGEVETLEKRARRMVRPQWADRLSLALIYRDDPDPRVQEACEDLVEGVMDDAE